MGNIFNYPPIPSRPGLAFRRRASCYYHPAVDWLTDPVTGWVIYKWINSTCIEIFEGPCFVSAATCYGDPHDISQSISDLMSSSGLSTIFIMLNINEVLPASGFLSAALHVVSTHWYYYSLSLRVYCRVGSTTFGYHESFLWLKLNNNNKSQ